MLPAGPVVALYFGSEFCEDRLPDLVEAKAFCAVAREGGLEPTLLTPLVTPEGLRVVSRLIAGLTANDWQPAVVFNDWGVLGLLRDRHPSLPRRAGRLMNRSLRDPRAYRELTGNGDMTRRDARLRQLFTTLGVEATKPTRTSMRLPAGRDGTIRLVGPAPSVHIRRIRPPLG
jgi:hypothetical protein